MASPRSSYTLPFLALLKLSCSSADQTTTTEEGTGTATSPVTETSRATSEDPPTTGLTAETSTSGSTTTGETTISSNCTNGVVEDSEPCDDGNDVNGDGCNSDCTVSGTKLSELTLTDKYAIRDIAVDPNGEVVVVGASESGGGRIWIARYTPQLVPLWSRTHGAGQAETVTGVTIGPEAIFAVGAVGETNEHDIWISRVGDEGELVWEKTYGGAGDDYASSVATSTEGDAIVGGLITVDGALSLSLQRYNAAGDSLWDTTFSLEGSTKIYPLGPGLAVTETDASLAFFRANQDATPESVITFPMSGGEPKQVFDIPQTSGILLGAATSNLGTLVVGTHLYESMIVRQLSHRGDVVWSSEDCVGETGRSVAVDEQGDVVIIGDGPGAKGDNIRLCKFDSAGVLRWGKDIDGSFGSDVGYAVAIGPDDVIVAGGGMLNEQNVMNAWLAVFSP